MGRGRMGRETSAKLGVIEGGGAVKIVPDEVRVWGQAGSHDVARLAAQSTHMRACFEEAAARNPGAQVEVAVESMYEPMHVGDDAPVLRLLRIAAERVGRPVRSARMGGGCDANILNR